MKPNHFLLFTMLLVSQYGCSQNQGQDPKWPSDNQNRIGGACEGCEAIYESIVPFDKLDETDTLPGYHESAAPLIVSGTVYKPDGITPAAGIVLYVYHTDQTGRYPKKGNESGWGRQHGYLRGWIKTNEKGEYKIVTQKPAAYPGTDIPAHIHIIVKEQGMNEYYIDDIQFNDDPLLTPAQRSRQRNLGGDGIISLRKSGNTLIGHRNIVLGKNVPGYPNQLRGQLQSGIEVGDDCPAFDPKHVTGPDAGSNVCPMCKYGFSQGIMIWWNSEKLDDLTPMLLHLETEIEEAGYSKLRVFVIYMNAGKLKRAKMEETLSGYMKNNALGKIAMTYIPVPGDPNTSGLYKINTSVASTIFVYKQRVVIAKYVNGHSGNTQLVLSNLQLK